MRFISHIRKFRVGIQGRRVEYLQGGIEREVLPEVTAVFHVGDVTKDEAEFAQRAFSLNGRTYEMDEVTPTPILGRLSTYDTESEANLAFYAQVDEQMGRKSGETKKIVEATLLKRSERSQSFKPFAEAPLNPPWPKYDEFRGSIADLVQRVLENGSHIPAVVAYERQNLSRPEVIEALEEEWRTAETAGADARFVNS